MPTVKLVKKAPKAAVSARLVTSDRLAAAGVDKRQLARLGFDGTVGQTVSWPGADRDVVMLVGVGPSAALDPDALRRAAIAFARACGTNRTAVLDGLADIDLGDVGPEGAVQALAEGSVLGGYGFDRYKSKPGERISTVSIVGTGDRAEAAALRRGVAIAEAVCFARDLVNEPGGTLTPTELAERVSARATDAGVGVRVLGPDGIAELGLGGLLAVNRGSHQEPRLVELTYEPEGATRSVALVGKGITFDSGGLSLKPAEAMMTMKDDMGGAAAVLATVCALPALGVAGVRVTAYAPLTDNMTGGDAQRPGDIYTARNGTTVEVLNTDAEGRLVLGDALALASEEAPDVLIDVATLTGACMVALGDKIAGLFSGDDDLVAGLESASAAVGERLWRLPMPDDYRALLDSPVADLKNIGSRYGGASTAALFLREFVGEGIPWAHIDIAGPAYNDGPASGELPAGGTGFGVRTLLRFIEDEAAAQVPDATDAAAE